MAAKTAQGHQKTTIKITTIETPIRRAAVLRSVVSMPTSSPRAVVCSLTTTAWTRPVRWLASTFAGLVPWKGQRWMELVNHLLVNPTTVTHEKCTAETGEFFVYLDARQAHDGVTVRADRRSEGGGRQWEGWVAASVGPYRTPPRGVKIKTIHALPRGL